MKGRSLILSIGICVVALLTALPPPAAARAGAQDEEEVREVYTGTLVGLGGRLAGRTTSFTFTVTARATRDQAMRYVELLRTKGQDALQKQIADRDMGSFALVGQTRRRVNLVYQQPTEEGTRIIALFERWIQPFELRYGTRSQTYPFSYLELSIDKSGKGSGTLIGAAKVYFEEDDPNTLTVENFGTYPVRVVNVKRSK